MKTPDDVFAWAESIMDSVEAITGGYQPFVSLEARERELGTAERIVCALRRAKAESGAREEENERLRLEYEQLRTDAKWMSEGPQHTNPVGAAWEVGFKEAVNRLRDAVEGQP
jgi:hypothetical protein